jgi:hypothetical protein
MRVYVPATFARVADLLGSGSLVGPVSAFAVTAALRAWAGGSGPSDEEELELVALSEAARGSLRLLAAAPDLQARRVVLAADVPDDHVRVDDGSELFGPGQVTVSATVPLAWIRAVHVDEPDAAVEVARGAAAVVAADGGDADAEASVATLEARELLWYAPHELLALVQPLS